MSVIAQDLVDIPGFDLEKNEEKSSRDRRPLGDALYGRFEDPETDSVEEVRDVRERI